MRKSAIEKLKNPLPFAILFFVLSVSAMVSQQTRVEAVSAGTIRVAFCPSWGNSSNDSRLIYRDLINYWFVYGDYRLEFVDLGFPITYQKLENTQADVLIVCDPAGGEKQYLESDVDAIQEFLLSGTKGIFISYLLQFHVGSGDYLKIWNDSVLAPLVGVKRSVFSPSAMPQSKMYQLLDPHHPLFANVSNPWNSGGWLDSQNLTVPHWSDAVFADARILAETNDSKAVVVGYDNLKWRGVYVSSMVDYFDNCIGGNCDDKQFVYNSILWLAHLTDSNPPIITVLSPRGGIYASPQLELNIAVDKPISWLGYSLDSQTNVTTVGNTTLPYLADGTHHLVIYANDTYGNIGSSDPVYFYIDTNPPNISDVYQIPPATEVKPQDRVRVNATVADDVSGISRVTLVCSYSNSSGTWMEFNEMRRLENDLWNASIPAFPLSTSVTYIIIAEDKAGNTVNTQSMGYQFSYHVIPESAYLVFLLSTLGLILSLTIVKRKKVTRLLPNT